ncbi:MAG: hypothetical protein ACM3WV_09720 [Bacillota bacterium]
MGKKAKREYIEVLRRRYKEAKGKGQKKAIIDESVANYGYHREYAIRY